MPRKPAQRDSSGAMGFLKDIRAFVLCCVTTLILLALWSVQAQAQIKWFAPYIIGAVPQPLMMTLEKPK